MRSRTFLVLLLAAPMASATDGSGAAGFSLPSRSVELKPDAPLASLATDDACSGAAGFSLPSRSVGLKPDAPHASRIDIAPLFRQQLVNADGTTTTVPIHGMEVLVARIGPDGKPILACVDSAEAAKRFLEAAIDTVARRRKEQ